MFRYSCKKILLLSFVCCLLTLAGCTKLPSYNLSHDGNPADVVTQFLDTVISGDGSDVSDLVENYAWQSGSDTPFGGAAVSESDLAIFQCVRESRAYELSGKSAYAEDEHHATVMVNYTSFDVGQFQKTLTEKVVAEVKGRQYEGEIFADSSDTTDIIEQNKAALLQNPKDFYTTQTYEVALVSRGGRWRIVISDDFYNALTGYAM